MLSTSEKAAISFHEYPAKNVGVRRAIADGHRWVLVTNPDILFSESLVTWLSAPESFPEAEDEYFRLDRYDFVSPVPRALPRRLAEDIARGSVASVESQTDAGLCERWARSLGSREHAFSEGVHTISVMEGEEVKTVGYASVFGSRDGVVSPATGATFGFCKVFVNDTDSFMNTDDQLAQRAPAPLSNVVTSCEKLHINAPGDFLLAPATAWSRMRGFGELPRSGVVDSVAILMLAHIGLKQHVLAPPNRIYHMDHSREEQVSRPQTIFKHTVVPTCTKHFGTGVDLVINKESWGHLGSQNILVTTFSLDAVRATLTKAEVEAKLDSLVDEVKESQRLLKDISKRKQGAKKRLDGNLQLRRQVQRNGFSKDEL